MDETPKPQYESHLVTTVNPDGTLSTEEVVVVPVWIHWKVTFVWKVRSLGIWVAQKMLGIAEWVVDTADAFAIRNIPPELIDDPNNRLGRKLDDTNG